MQINDPALPRPSGAASLQINRSCRLYEILTSADPIEIENLPAGGVQRPLVKEAVMLDLVFVALGFALIGLMGLYAVGLAQL